MKYETLGSYLKESRKKAGWTQWDVAKKLGYSSPQFISNVERGLCELPLSKIKKLREALNLDRDTLIHLLLKPRIARLRRELFPLKVRNVSKIR